MYITLWWDPKIVIYNIFPRLCRSDPDFFSCKSETLSQIGYVLQWAGLCEPKFEDAERLKKEADISGFSETFNRDL